MTSRERIMAVLRGKKPDRIPWAPLIDEYYVRYLHSLKMDVDIVKSLRLVGADIIERHVPVYKNEFPSNIEIRTEKKGNEEIRYTITPVGTLKEIFTFAGETNFLKSHRVKTVEDVKILKYIFENIEVELEEKTFKEEDNYIGDSGIASAEMPQTPIQHLLENEMGIENFTYVLYDYQEEIEELMEIIHAYNLKVAKKLTESCAEVIFGYEDTSTTVLSKDWYKDYCSNYIDEYADIFHKGDKIYITHMCGKLKGFAGIIQQNKMDGIDSLCPPTTGDVWAHEALELFKGKIIIGGIEPSALQRMSVGETEEYVINLLKSIAPGTNFILSTGDATAYGTPLENLKKVSELIMKFGKYPLQIT